MFKLTRIINSGVNVPEPEMLPVQSSIIFAAGSTAVLNGGTLTLGNETTKPTHIIIRKKPKGENVALCYRINPNMIFKVQIVGDYIDNLCEGKIVCLHTDGLGYTKCSDTTEGGVALINDMNGAIESGDSVYVSFQ